MNIAPRPGMYPVGYHVREREEGAAYGPEPLLWGRELLHHPPGGGRVLGAQAHPLLTSRVGCGTKQLPRFSGRGVGAGGGVLEVHLSLSLLPAAV